MLQFASSSRAAPDHGTTQPGRAPGCVPSSRGRCGWYPLRGGAQRAARAQVFKCVKRERGNSLRKSRSKLTKCVSALRSVGLAARYVSGYLRLRPRPGEEELVAGAAQAASLTVASTLRGA